MPKISPQETNMKLRFLILSLLLSLTGCVFTEQGTKDNANTNNNHSEHQANQPTANDSEPEIDPIEVKLKELTTAQKIGQLVMAGIEGTQVNDTTERLITEDHIGGFIFYGSNIKSKQEALKLFNDLKQVNINKGAKVPLFMSVDEEGGRVTRMPKELTKLPSAQKIGATQNTDLALKIGDVIGEQLQSFGLNMDYAPVLDVNSNPDNPVIGDRAYGDDPKLVSSMGISVMKGLQQRGVIPVIKHFPGHGDTSVDSHLGLPIVTHDLKRLRQLELVPFQQAINDGADAVMIAHILMPKLDKDAPASFSSVIIHDLLREELGFEGVVISDDMTMGAITEHYDMSQAAVKFVRAGGNIVLVGHGEDNIQSVVKALTVAVEQGDISINVLNERVTQILKLKEKYKLDDTVQAEGPDITKINGEIAELLKQF